MSQAPEAVQAIESLLTCDLLSGEAKSYLLDLRDVLLGEQSEVTSALPEEDSVSDPSPAPLHR